MKRKAMLSVGITLGLGLLLSLTWVGISHAIDVRTGAKPTLAAGDTTDSSLYAVGDDILIAGTVKGDLYCMGANIEVVGTVEGDVLCAGQSIRVSGKVLGDVRIAAQQIDLAADVDGSATLLGDSVILDHDGRVTRDMTMLGNRLDLEGAVGRDTLAKGSALTVSGTIGRNVNAHAQDVTLTAKSHIVGDFDYKSQNEAGVAKTALVDGATHYTHDAGRRPAETLQAVVSSGLYIFFSLVFLGGVMLLAAPRKFETISQTVQQRPLLSFGAGFLAIVATPIIGILLAITGVGFPLGVVLLLAWAIGLVVALPFSAYALGWLITRQFNWPARGRRAVNLLLGLLLIIVLSSLPMIGAIVAIISEVCGFGAVLVAGKNHSLPMVAMANRKEAKAKA